MQRVAAALTRWCTRWVPDSYVIAGVLSLLVFFAALIATGGGVAPKRMLDLVKFWGDGFWSQFPFTMRMAMVIITGYLVADAPPMRAALKRLAGWPQTPRAAVALMAMVSMGLAWVNWGLSIIASAILARAIGRRRMGVDFRLLVATAYLGLGCMWHAGLSASAPLTSSDPAEKFVKEHFGGVPVPATETVFSSFNLILAFAVLVIMTLFATMLQPRRPVESAVPEPDPEDEADEPIGPPTTPAQWLERSPFITLFVAAGIFVYLISYFIDRGAARITIDQVNFFFLGLGALLHWTPASLLRSAERGGRYVWGVLLQFAFYAGIGGMLDKSGLASNIAGGFTRIANRSTFPLLVVWYSGLLNYAVPSGGAKWFIEVGYLADAAHRLGVPMSKTIVAYAWGDMFTDIIQPFWAIPLLAFAKLGFRDIMGYCLLFFLVYATIVSAGFLAWGYM
jgi:short-chain fatty acids transporter